MASLYDKLLYLNETKGLIREAIEDQDVEVPQDTPFREYAEKIAQIKGKVWSVNGQTGDVTLTLEDLNGLSKEEIEALIKEAEGKIPSLSGYATESWVQEQDYATNSSLNDAKSELEGQISDIQDDLANNYETKSGVSSLIEASLNDSKDYTDKSIKDAELKAGYGIKIENKEISVTLDTEVFKVVTELPQEGQPNKIYLVPSTDTKENDVYDEYAWINGEWEKIGERNVEVDLSDYIKEADADKKYGTLVEQQQLRSDVEDIMGEVATLEADKADKSEIPDVSGFATKEELNDKQDTLVSGTNLKTINGESLLGSGNLEIEGGSGDANVVPITQNDYDNLQDKDPNTIYVITDAEPLTVEGISDEDKEELKSLRNDVEQALGEIAELGADKQNKLIGNYLVKFEQNGGMIDFTQRGFDGLSESTKSISFKTINGQSLLGQGDLKIEGGSGGDCTCEAITREELFSLEPHTLTDINRNYFCDNASNFSNVFLRLETFTTRPNYQQGYWNFYNNSSIMNTLKPVFIYTRFNFYNIPKFEIKFYFSNAVSKNVSGENVWVAFSKLNTVLTTSLNSNLYNLDTVADYTLKPSASTWYTYTVDTDYKENFIDVILYVPQQTSTQTSVPTFYLAIKEPNT